MNGDEFIQDSSTAIGPNVDSTLVLVISEIPVHPCRDSSNNELEWKKITIKTTECKAYISEADFNCGVPVC